MDENARFEDLVLSDKQTFQKICRKLLKMTFIVREKNDEHRKDFNFIKKYQCLFHDYLSVMGYDVVCNVDQGVARLINIANADDDAKTAKMQLNKKTFKLSDSIVLLALWFEYDNSIRNKQLMRSVIIDKIDLDNRLDKIGMKSKLNKSALSDALSLFSSYNLVEVIGEIGDLNCRIKLYPAIQFCLNEDEFCRQIEIVSDMVGVTSGDVALVDGGVHDDEISEGITENE